MTSDDDFETIAKPRFLTAVGVVLIALGIYGCVRGDWVVANDATFNGLEGLAGGLLCVWLAVSVSRSKRRAARARQNRSGSRELGGR
ncbi:hypothetical protein [Streptomyces albidus (ex Kaewkla and Franco 2022)]|uniref:hypothetical protein n=1 Tax=Streptomyces albidus (ex Kaewkla and Franco 2022) TaxID=722709 RepID=UPI0015EF9750|nr:hypothetical protein [Streptomyces albidus (ex Kaewkla and Franco 2022)]